MRRDEPAERIPWRDEPAEEPALVHAGGPTPAEGCTKGHEGTGSRGLSSPWQQSDAHPIGLELEKSLSSIVWPSKSVLFGKINWANALNK